MTPTAAATSAPPVITTLAPSLLESLVLIARSTMPRMSPHKPMRRTWRPANGRQAATEREVGMLPGGEEVAIFSFVDSHGQPINLQGKLYTSLHVSRDDGPRLRNSWNYMHNTESICKEGVNCVACSTAISTWLQLPKPLTFNF